jgi:hypothetical protein
LQPEDEEKPGQAFLTTITEELELNTLHLGLSDRYLATALISDIRRPLLCIVDDTPNDFALEGKYR